MVSGVSVGEESLCSPGVEREEPVVIVLCRAFTAGVGGGIVEDVNGMRGLDWEGAMVTKTPRAGKMVKPSMRCIESATWSTKVCRYQRVCKGLGTLKEYGAVVVKRTEH